MFEERQDIHLAELIIGHLNEKGFLETPLEEIAPCVPLKKMQGVLETIQSCDPPGIGARNLQECLLLQLKLKHQENSQAALVITEHFSDLIHNRLPFISQKLHLAIAQLVQIVEKQIAPLDLNPGYRFCSQPIVAVVPDLLILFVDEKWQIEVNTSFLPKFQIAPIYLQALYDNSLGNEEYDYLRRQLTGGRWLKRIVQKRNHTLRSIGQFLLKKQKAFFSGDKAALVPLTMREASEELSIHESTVARAVANKFIACPQGVFALKFLFKQGVETKSGEKISNHSLRQILAKTINEEEKLHPLSDEQLAKHFSKLGIHCARRTIAKYRSSLNIPAASKRKKWPCATT
jgi:RNA polymerase sigma-54 factor